MAERGDALWTNWVLTHSPKVTVKVLQGLEVMAVMATFFTLWCCVPRHAASNGLAGGDHPTTQAALWLSLWLFSTAALQLLALPLRVHLLYLLCQLKGGSGGRVQLARTLHGPSWRGKKVVGQTTLVLLLAGGLCLGAFGKSPLEAALWRAVLWAECAMVARTLLGVTVLTVGLQRYGAASKDELGEELRSALQLFKHEAAGSGERTGGTWALPPDCAVCLEDLGEGAELARLPCTAGDKTGGHVFHAACIMTWLVKNPSCPLCSAGVLPGVFDKHVD